MNLKYPSTPDNNLASWYLILWRIPWYMIFEAAIAIATICMVLTHGYKEAAKYWQDVK